MRKHFFTSPQFRTKVVLTKVLQGTHRLIFNDEWSKNCVFVCKDGFVMPILPECATAAASRNLLLKRAQRWTLASQVMLGGSAAMAAAVGLGVYVIDKASNSDSTWGLAIVGGIGLGLMCWGGLILLVGGVASRFYANRIWNTTLPEATNHLKAPPVTLKEWVSQNKSISLTISNRTNIVGALTRNTIATKHLMDSGVSWYVPIGDWEQLAGKNNKELSDVLTIVDGDSDIEPEPSVLVNLD